MLIKGVIHEDFVNYQKPCMTIMFPICNGFKCGGDLCQNSSLATSPSISVPTNKIVEAYIRNDMTSAICCQGLEPMDSFGHLLKLVRLLREQTDDDIVIYTGYTKEEVEKEVEELKQYKNIIVKFGRFIPNQQPHYDAVLGVNLASDNQYAEKIS